MESLWIKTVSLGITENMPVHDRRVIRNLNALSISSFPAPLLLSLYVTADKFSWVPFLAGTMMSINLLMLPVFNHFRLYFVGKMVHYSVMLSGIIVCTYYYGFGHGIELSVLIMFVGAFTFSHKISEISLFAILSTMSFGACLVIGYTTTPVVEFEGKETLHFLLATLTLSIIFFSMLIVRKDQGQYEQMIDDKNHLLQAQKEELLAQNESTVQLMHQVSEKNKEITSSINYAYRIQQAILPELKTIEKDLPGTSLVFRPRNVVSGDFFWHYSRNNKVYIAIADCTGHGVPGALLSMMGSSLLTQIVQSTLADSPALILKYLDIQMSEMLNREKNESSDGMEIVMFVFDKQMRQIKLCSVNRKYILQRQGVFQEHRGTRYYIGKGTVKDVELKDERFDLAAGDSLYLFTDGITDQYDATNQKKFGAKQLVPLLERVSLLDDSVERGRLIDQAITRWQGDTGQTDDILLMAFKF